jgi:hypothetical protein
MGRRAVQRLITFGCSYTYGTALPDCKNWMLDKLHNLQPSNMGWASLLAQKLGLECVNESFPGASNSEIMYNVLKYNYKKHDTVVIMWTHYARDMLFNFSYKYPFFRDRLGPWAKTHQERKWAEYLSEKDYAMKSWFHIHHADLYLQQQGVKYIHYPATPKELDSYRLEFINVNNYHSDGIEYVDKATDDMHPGIQSNRLLAEKMYRILND